MPCFSDNDRGRLTFRYGVRGIAFAYDPDGYWVELIDRSATFAGIAANL